MNWRPENWETPKVIKKQIDGQSVGIIWEVAHSHGWRDGYEAGADAMLEALRKTGNYHKGGTSGEYAWSGIAIPKGFTLVIIPEEE